MNVYYLLRSYTNPIFGKTLGPSMWVKVFSANQIARFLIQLYPDNFLHAGTYSRKLKLTSMIFEPV